jgi:Putative beta-lactamase-inhibitor-like, PepSY-like
MKTIITLLFVALISTFTFAQKISDKEVPAMVGSSFKIKFPTATNAKWEKENGTEYEVNFKLEKVNYSAKFGSEGKWMETENGVAVSALPAAVAAALKTDFPGFKIEEAEKVESAENGICYEVKAEKGKEEYEVLLSADGKVLKKTLEKEGKD